MTLNDKYCKLLDFDFGYDNKALADKIEKISKEYLIEVIEWLSKNEFNIDYYVRLGKTDEIIKEFEKQQE